MPFLKISSEEVSWLRVARDILLFLPLGEISERGIAIIVVVHPSVRPYRRPWIKSSEWIFKSLDGLENHFLVFS